jgi:uncharacterized protein
VVRKPQGFAALSPERRREIARLGGMSVPPDRRSFSRDPDLAARAGAAGGAKSRGGGRPPGGRRKADDRVKF